MAKKNAAPPATAEGTTAVAEAPAAAAAKAPEVPMVTSTELAKQLNTNGPTLRRWLRTLPQFQDAGYTRYKWPLDDPFLKEAAASFAKHQKSDEEKKAARLEEARKKAEAKKEEKPATDKPAKGKGKPAPAAEPEDQDEDEEFEDDEEGEDLE